MVKSYSTFFEKEKKKESKKFFKDKKTKDLAKDTLKVGVALAIVGASLNVLNEGLN